MKCKAGTFHWPVHSGPTSLLTSLIRNRGKTRELWRTAHAGVIGFALSAIALIPVKADIASLSSSCDISRAVCARGWLSEQEEECKRIILVVNDPQLHQAEAVCMCVFADLV